MICQKLRLQKGWSQQQLAEFSGLSTRTIQRVEKGESISLETAKCLAATFLVDVSTFTEPPMNTLSQDPTQALLLKEEAEAFAYIRRLRGFYRHLAKYALFLVIALCLKVFVYPEKVWMLWAILGWGCGLAYHALRLFTPARFLNGKWERQQVEARLGRKLV